MRSKIVIVGKAASGKDYLQRKMTKRGFKYCISHTTRSPRVGEVGGEDYHFISDELFDDMVENGDFIEHQNFRGWRYGTTVHEFNECDVMILNAESVNSMIPKYREMCFVLYLDIPRLERVNRLNHRNDKNENFMERLQSDDEQFVNFSNYDCIINNSNF